METGGFHYAERVMTASGSPSTAIGAKLRELRQRHGLSQRELARRLGISHTRMGAYERGVAANGQPAIPGPGLLAKAAERLEFPYEALLRLAGHPTEPAPAADPDPGISELLGIYHALPDGRRRMLLDLARTVWAAESGTTYGG